MRMLRAAQSTLLLTRQFLKGSLKSNNKRYDPPSLPSFFDDEIANKFNATAEKKAQWETRNANQALADQKFQSTNYQNIHGNISIAEMGRRLYNAGLQNKGEFWGNCGEQAAIAIHIAHEYLDVQYDFLWNVTWMHGGFSHSACWIGDKADRAGAAFCDPWMNIACLNGDYAARAGEKLKEWTKKGKRLSVGEIGTGIFRRTNWLEPTNGKVVGFWNAPETYMQHCMTVPKYANRG